jgi:glycosyltransferase involved in cell wall biosynthesis
MSVKLTVWIFQTGEPLPTDEGNSRPMRAINLSNALVSAGHNVVLWSSAFNHQKKNHRVKKHTRTTISNSLTVNLIPSPGYKKNISIGRLYDHFRLALNLNRALKLEKNKPDIAFIGYPPIESAYVITRWLRSKKVPYILDVKDQWPSFIVDALPKSIRGLGRAILSPYFILAKKTMMNATGISAMAEDFLNWALDFSNRPKTLFDIVIPLTAPINKTNNYDLNKAFEWWSNLKVINNGKMKIMFVGSHYPSLDFLPIFRAAEICIERGLECEFIICGEGELTQDLLKKATKYPNVILPGWVDRSQIDSLAMMSTATIAPFKNIDSFIKSLPNKIIDSLSLGLPILSPLQGEVKRLIEKEEVGLIYRQGSGESLFDCINKLILDTTLNSKLSLNASSLYNKKFSYEVVYTKTTKHLENMSLNFSEKNNLKT